VVVGPQKDVAAGVLVLDKKRSVVRACEWPHASYNPLVDIPSLSSASSAVFTARSLQYVSGQRLGSGVTEMDKTRRRS